jgi:hypothetical protein
MAATSTRERRAHEETCCQVGLASNAEQAPPGVATSGHSPLIGDGWSAVAPTAVTYRDAAGYRAPKPESPALAVMATPGWLLPPDWMGTGAVRVCGGGPGGAGRRTVRAHHRERNVPRAAAGPGRTVGGARRGQQAARGKLRRGLPGGPGAAAEVP